MSAPDHVSMMKIARAATDPLGPTHVGVFLAIALGASDCAGLHPRPDIFKCAGTNLAGCSVCVRKLAPAGDGQRWARPDVQGETCSMFASVEQHEWLYREGSK